MPNETAAQIEALEALRKMSFGQDIVGAFTGENCGYLFEMARVLHKRGDLVHAKAVLASAVRVTGKSAEELFNRSQGPKGERLGRVLKAALGIAPGGVLEKAPALRRRLEDRIEPYAQAHLCRRYPPEAASSATPALPSM